MRNVVIVAVLAISLLGCKSVQTVTAVKAPEKAGSVSDVAANHKKTNISFRTAYIKASAKYHDEKQSQNISAEIRISKGEKILVSVRFLGITMAKALITPNSVKYYEKINGNYFEGDYASLSKWLGTELDYARIEKLLTGVAMDDLAQENFNVTLDGGLYKLHNASGSEIDKSYELDAINFFLKRMVLSQTEPRRQLDVAYPKYRIFAGRALPESIDIEATQEKGVTSINIQYNDATFDEEISFPYSVPEGYERVYIR